MSCFFIGLRSKEPSQLLFAASSSYRREGNLKVANTLKNMSNLEKQIITPEKALTTLMDCGLSKHKYNLLRKSSKNSGMLLIVLL